MKAKAIITVLLLGFVGLSVGVMLVRELGGQAPEPEKDLPDQPAIVVEETPALEGVFSYYFHGNVRCATCQKIEGYSKEAIDLAFSEALADKTLVWAAVNVDESAQEHFVEDFQLSTRSIVLAEYKAGEVTRWKNLDRVWELVKNKAAFTAYIQEEVTTFLGQASS